MSNIDNCDSVYKIDNCGSVYKNERQILENEEEFIYTSINPFCETVVEQKLSKEKLKRILERGMQKSIPLEKVKKAKEKIENIGMGSYLEVTKEIECNDREVRLSKKFATAILDKLIESEKFYCADFEKRGDLDGSN